MLTVIREIEESVFVGQNPDGTYRIGIVGVMAIAKPSNANWQTEVKNALTIEDDEDFEEAICQLMK